MKGQRLSTLDIVAMKRRGERIASLTAYDYTSAQMIDAAGVPLILVGDTLGMVVQGHDTTLPVTLDQIIYHSQMVARGSQRALLVGDMPFMTYQVSVEDALRNSRSLDHRRPGRCSQNRRRPRDGADHRKDRSGRHPGVRSPWLHAAVNACHGWSAYSGP